MCVQTFARVRVRELTRRAPEVAIVMLSTVMLRTTAQLSGRRTIAQLSGRRTIAQLSGRRTIAQLTRRRTIVQLTRCGIRAGRKPPDRRDAVLEEDRR